MKGTLQATALAVLIAVASACVIVVDDEELARQVGDTIEDDPLLRTEDLRVSVRRGVVTLNGEVSDIPTLERAVDVANSVEGVRRVVSRLAVEVSSSQG